MDSIDNNSYKSKLRKPEIELNKLKNDLNNYKERYTSIADISTMISDELKIHLLSIKAACNLYRELYKVKMSEEELHIIEIALDSVERLNECIENSYNLFQNVNVIVLYKGRINK